MLYHAVPQQCVHMGQGGENVYNDQFLIQVFLKILFI